MFENCTIKIGNILWLIADGKVVGYQVVESNFATTSSCIGVKYVSESALEK